MTTAQERVYDATGRRPGLNCRNTCLAGVVAGRYGCHGAVSGRVAVGPLSDGLCAAPQQYRRGVLCPALPDQRRLASNALAQAASTLTTSALTQLLLLYTCRAHPILADFVCDVYWERYSAGHESISNTDAQAFVTQAVRDGKTQRPWSENTIKNVASYLTGCCADYGLLERGQKSTRKMRPYLLESTVAVYLAYDLHSAWTGG